MIKGFLYIFQEHVCQIAVPMFFVISGYLFYRNFTMDKLFKKWKSRIHTLLVPYLLWNTLTFVFYYCISNAPITRSILDMEAIELTIENIVQGVFFHSYTVLWFVKVLMIFVLLAPAFYLLLKQRYIATGAMIAFFIIGAFYPHKSINSVLYTVGFYFFGGYLAVFCRDKIETCQNKKNIFIAAICMLVAFAISNVGINGCFYAFKLIWVIGLWIVADIFKEYRTPKEWVKISFFIYCSHEFFIRLFEKIIWKINSSGGIENILFTIVITISSITICAQIMKKLFYGMWKVLNGGRG